MNLLKTLGIVLALSLTACATSTNVSSRANAEPCVKLEEQPLKNFGQAVEALFYTMDMYDICRAKMDALIKFDKERQ